MPQRFSAKQLFLLMGLLLTGNHSLDAQEILLGGGLQASDSKDARAANIPIETKWGSVVEQWSIRIAPGAKSLWGTAEAPTFLLQIRNVSKDTRKLQISEENLHLVINGKKYQWDSPGTQLISTLNPGETKENLFVLRFDRSQWKPVGENEKDDSDRLAALSVGKKEFELQIRIPGKGQEVTLKSDKIKIEITQSAFELPTVVGVLLGSDGKPVKEADIYLCRDAQFSIYYSGYNGKWFTNKSISHYDPFRGGFSQASKPVKTNDKGQFSISPDARHKRIVVLPPQGSAQVFDLPTSFREWKVKLKPTGSLVVEQDIEGESGTTNASIYSSRRLAVNPQNKTQNYMITESFSIPLTQGKKYTFDNMAPETFRLNKYKYVRIGNRSFSVGRQNLEFSVKPGETTEFRMVRKTGQRVSVTAKRIPSNMHYLVASIFELDEGINLTSVYNNRTLWSDATAENKKEVAFKSALISPGKYRLVLMSVPQGSRPNQYTYKPDFVGSKVIEVKNGGELDIGDVDLFPVKTWVHNSGMALMVKFEQPNGESAGSQSMQPINVGYGNTFDGQSISADSSGVATAVRAPGVYRFVAGLHSNQATLFDVQVPRMTAKKIVLVEKPEWEANAELKPKLAVTASFDEKTRKIKLTVENKGDKSFRPRVGDVQLLVQTLATNFSSGVLFMPDTGAPLYQNEIKAMSTAEYVLEWDALLAKGLCTTASTLAPAKLKDFKESHAESMVLGSVKVGPEYSQPFPVPALPILKPKPFR